NLPPNLPPAVVQQLLPSIVAQIQIQVVPLPPVDFQLIHAIMESHRVAKQVRRIVLTTQPGARTAERGHLLYATLRDSTSIADDRRSAPLVHRSSHTACWR